MSLNKRIKTNIKKFHFLYFLCTIGMIGVFMYIAWKNDLSDETFFWGAVFFVFTSWQNLDVLMGGSMFSSLYDSYRGTDQDASMVNIEAISLSGYAVLIVTMWVLVDLGTPFNTLPTNLLFFGVVFFFLFVPLWLSWEKTNVLRKLFDGFVFSYFIVIPQLDLSLYYDDVYILAGLSIALSFFIADYLMGRRKKGEIAD